MIASSFSKNSFLLVLAAPSSSLISASGQAHVQQVVAQLALAADGAQYRILPNFDFCQCHLSFQYIYYIIFLLVWQLCGVAIKFGCNTYGQISAVRAIMLL